MKVKELKERLEHLETPTEPIQINEAELWGLTGESYPTNIEGHLTICETILEDYEIEATEIKKDSRGFYQVELKTRELSGIEARRFNTYKMYFVRLVQLVNTIENN